MRWRRRVQEEADGGWEDGEMYHELEKLEDPNQKYLSLFISACLCLYDVLSRRNI